MSDAPPPNGDGGDKHGDKAKGKRPAHKTTPAAGRRRSHDEMTADNPEDELEGDVDAGESSSRSRKSKKPRNSGRRWTREEVRCCKHRVSDIIADFS